MTDQNKPVTAEKEMSFLDHVEELRWHIIRSVTAIVIVATLVFIFKDLVTRVMYAPRYSSFITHSIICQYTGMHCDVTQFKMITGKLGEEFMTHLKTSFWLGLIFAFPYIIWEVWRFVKPGLYEHEQKAARGIVGVCSILFFLGVMFGYFIITPFAINFLTSYTFGETNEQTVMLGSYIATLTSLLFPTGMAFELPVIAYGLAKVGVLSSTFMKHYRRHAIVIIFIVAAIITPPDFYSQLFIGFPLIGLYELSIRVVKRVEKARKDD